MIDGVKEAMNAKNIKNKFVIKYDSFSFNLIFFNINNIILLNIDT